MDSNNIEKFRKERGWSMEQLAEACDPPTTASQINKLEKSQRQMDVEWVGRLCKALRARPHALVPGLASLYPPDIVALMDRIAHLDSEERKLMAQVDKTKAAKKE